MRRLRRRHLEDARQPYATFLQMPAHEPIPPERCRERKRVFGVTAADRPFEGAGQIGVIARERRQRVLLRLASELWLELRRHPLVPLSMPTQDSVLVRG